MIDSLQSMKLLAKLALDKNKYDLKQSMVAYYAGGHTLWDFRKTDHPLVEQFKDKSWLEVMQYLCPEYDKETFDSFRIKRISDNDVAKTVRELKKTIDPETAEALDYGVWLGYL